MEMFSIGHSTHPLDAFADLLARHRVACVADVRRFPASRRSPQFGREALRDALAERGILYEHLPELGGRRRVSRGSPNEGWTNQSFRGYADHMASAEFAEGLGRLEALGRARATAAMCAEAAWWRCHRRMVADALVARGWSVRHIGADGRLSSHELTGFAAIEDMRLTYPAGAGPAPRLPGFGHGGG